MAGQFNNNNFEYKEKKTEKFAMKHKKGGREE